MSSVTSRKHILLMTATINPYNAVELVRTDPVARLKDYETALSFYLTLIDCPLHGIIFVENSDSDVTTLRKLAEDRGLADRIEFICNYGVYNYSERVRPYGEFKLLDYAMTASQIVSEAGAAHVVWKITGRYIVRNLRSIVDGAPASFDAYVDMKNSPIRWLDMRLMAWTKEGYDHLFRGAADELDSQMHETTMREYVPKRAHGVRLVPRFRQEPLVDGIRGLDDRHYSRGKNLVKFYVRSVSRVLTPWYWI